MYVCMYVCMYIYICIYIIYIIYNIYTYIYVIICKIIYIYHKYKIHERKQFKATTKSSIYIHIVWEYLINHVSHVSKRQELFYVKLNDCLNKYFRKENRFT